jgi:DNA-binding transcriptional ArsR family regulator
MDYKPKIKLSQDEFRVLASNTRIDILKLLDESQFTVSDISRKLDMNKATVHEHLTKLMEVGLVKKDDSPRKWVYYRLTWKGRNLLHPERVRVMVSLGIMLTVIVLGVLLVAANTDFIGPDSPDDPDIPPASTTVHVFWDDSGQANTFDIHLQTSTAMTITKVQELETYIEPDAYSINKDEPIELGWAYESDIIHLYDYDNTLDGFFGKYLYVEGTLLDDRSVERPFNLRRFLVPQGFEVDLRISPLGISIDISNLTDGIVTISFEVENVGTADVNSTLVEVFSVLPTFRASGFPSYGSPYLREIFNDTLDVSANSSKKVMFEVDVTQLFRTGIVVVVDPDNEMAEQPTGNNMDTKELPDIVRDNNAPKEGTDGDESASMNLGFVAILVTVIILIVLIIVALLVLK